MSTVPAGPYQLLKGMLAKGLPFVASHLEARIKHPVIITDNVGQIHYPDMSGRVSIDEQFVKLPPDLKENGYCYREENKTLYFQIGRNRIKACLVLENLPPNRVEQIILQLDDDVKLAIEYYFSNLQKIKEQNEKFEKDLAEYLFFKSNAPIRDIIKLSGVDLDAAKPYFVSIVEIDETDVEVDWQLITSYSREFLKRNKLPMIPLTWPNCLLGIASALYNNDTLEIEPDWPWVIDSINYKDFIEKRFNITISQGIGQIYSLSNLHKSYNEARIAITLPRLMGKRSFVQHFSELGVFSLIFSQDIETVKKYCLKELGPLLEYDENNKDGLLPTLRKLLDTSFNWKTTASSLFIHVNTLYYRVNKIEKLLNTDLSQMNTRSNLFIAIKVWDTLKILGFLD